MKEFLKKNYYYLSLGAIFALFLVTRLWRITTLPSNLHIDEASIAYDAWCLANYGVDRYLKSWPVYLINFGGGQNVLYCYILAGLFKLFGYHFFLIRMPAVFFSFLNILFGIRIVRKIYPEKRWLSLFVGALLTICPYFILAGRFGLESNLMLGMSTVFLYCFICAAESGRYVWYILAGIAGGLVLYTYAISYMVLPVFLFLGFIYIVWIRRFSFLRWISMAIPMGILALPLLLVQYINAFDLEEMHLGPFTITKLPVYRVSEIGRFSKEYIVQIFKSVFIGDWARYNSIPEFPNMYYITIPLIVLGIMRLLVLCRKSFAKREFAPQIYLFFWFVITFLAGGSIESNCNRVNGIYFCAIFLAAEGILFLMDILKKQRRMIPAICSVLYGISFLSFGMYYYGGSYAKDYYPLDYFHNTISEAVEFLEENPQYQNRMTYMADVPIYLALSMLRSPYEMRFDENEYLFFDYYYCSSLPEIEEECNYIVNNIYAEYADELRSLGYMEKRYAEYSLFIWDNANSHD